MLFSPLLQIHAVCRVSVMTMMMMDDTSIFALKKTNQVLGFIIIIQCHGSHVYLSTGTNVKTIFNLTIRD